MESKALTGMTITVWRLTCRRQVYLPVVFLDGLSFLAYKVLPHKHTEIITGHVVPFASAYYIAAYVFLG
jgi:hypothetical protein